MRKRSRGTSMFLGLVAGCVAGLRGRAGGIRGDHFRSGGELGVGLGPSSVAMGDFNGDGELDLATAKPTPNSVSVLVNTSVFLQLGSADFGDQQAGTISGLRSVTVTNPGPLPVLLSAANITGLDRDEFIKTSDDCTSVVIGAGRWV